MNSEGFNTKAINGTKYADAIRSVVYGFLSATGIASPRAFRRDPAYYTFEASNSGILGRVFARSEELITAAFEATVRQVVKSSLPATSTITAVIDFVGRVLRLGPLSGVAETTLASTGYMQASGQVFVSAGTSLSQATKVMHRIVVDGQVEASIVHFGAVRGRQYASVGAQTLASVSVVVEPHRFSPTPVSVYASAHAAVDLKRLIRSKEYLSATSEGFVQSEVHRRLPFDENASADRTFTSPAVETVFYVTE